MTTRSRNSDALESTYYARRSADYAWQLFLASCMILVRPPPSPPKKNPSNHPPPTHAGTLPPPKHTPTHPPSTHIPHLPLLPPRTPRCPILHLRINHPPRPVLPFPHARHGFLHGRTRSRSFRRRGIGRRARVVVGCIRGSEGEIWRRIGEMG